MAKRAHAEDGASVSDHQSAFSPSKRQQLSGNGDNFVEEQNTMNGAVATMEEAAGTASALDAAGGVEATAKAGGDGGAETSVGQEDEEQKEDESDPFHAELSAVFEEQQHSSVDGDVPSTDGGAEEAIVEETAPGASANTSEPMQVDSEIATAAAASNSDTHSANAAADATDATGSTTSTPMVIAPMFAPVHRSWEEFEQSLKDYAQATYQLYVIRTTTSVKRRNQRITENASSSSSTTMTPGMSAVSGAAGSGDGDEVDDAQLDEQSTAAAGAAGETSRTTPLLKEAQEVVQPLSSASASAPSLLSSETVVAAESQQLIPESYQWYSKTLMCTHGWKDRNRGSGKRSLSVVRSTSCPAKMCVTLQHRGKGDEGWQVVLTRHVRTHNHQLSKELYLYYMENRRIYDPDLLLVVGSPSANANANASSPAGAPSNQQQVNRSGLSHLLTTIEGQKQQHSALSYDTSGVGKETSNAGAKAGGGRGDEGATKPATAGADGTTQGGFQAQKALVKMHDSWEHFQKYIAEYSTLSSQSFRARSTVSVAAKNLKTKSLALKAGRSEEEVDTQLIPENERWYSKMLICNHGWKRKSRSKAPKNSTQLDDALSFESVCPAMLMARLQRDVNDKWCVVIHRQVLDHNHSPLKVAVNAAAGATGNRVSSSAHTAPKRASAFVDAMDHAQESNSQHHSAFHYFGGDMSGSLSDGQEHEREEAARDQHHQGDEQQSERDEIVVRVPKLEAVHASWEAFHARLQEYSDATFQLYRTRTTSSVQGRNQKIPETKRGASTDTMPTMSSTVDDGNKAPSDSRVIPEEWKWYSKTLTCTHGWKERRRGTGKRTVQVFRSTACPVKICATVQFVEDTVPEVDNDGAFAADNQTSLGGAWRVVVTKHVVDHNHNLSKELHQHYCENRRIYDPDLLTIDESHEAAVVKPKKQPHNFLLGGDDQSLLPHGTTSFHSSGASTATGAESSTQAQLNVVHPFTLLGETSLLQSGHTGRLNSHGGNVHSGTTANDGSSSNSVLPTPLISYSGAFPSTAGSHALFRTAMQQNPPFMFQAHQYFAADQSSSLGFAPSQFPINSVGNSSANSVGNTAYSVGSSGFLAAPCRVHGGAGMQLTPRPSDGIGQCTCFRGPSASINPKAPSARHTNLASLSQAHSNKQKQTRDRRLLQGDDGNDFDDDGVEEENDEASSAGSVWIPTLDTEILTLTSNAGATFWRAPKIKRLHATWEAFQEHLDAYTVATYQLFRVRTTSSVSSRNTRIAQQIADRGEMSTPVVSAEALGTPPPTASSPQLVPDSYQWYSKTFVCTHGWKERRRGKGQRVSHSLRSTACSAKLCVTLQRVVHEANKWHVVVTRQGTDHNHEISLQAYQQYSEVRRIKDSSLLDQAEELWKKGMTRRKIFEFLKDQAPNAILMKDVHNLVQRWQQKHGKINSDDGTNDAAAEVSEPTATTTDAASAVAAPSLPPQPSATKTSQEQDASMMQDI